MQHITCANCVPGPSVEAGEKEPKVQCVECGNLMLPCRIGNFLLSNLLLDCVNKANGCFVSLGLSDPHNCSHSDYDCPICESESFVDVTLMRAHIDEEHRIRIPIVIGKETKLTMQRKKVILEDRATNDLFLLCFEEGTLSLQHMVGDQPRKHTLTAYLSGDDDDYWGFGGNTSKMARFPAEANLKLPSLFDELFTENKPAFCEVGIFKKTNPEGNSITIRLDGLSLNDREENLECVICFRIVRHPVYHCLVGHPTCGKCLDKDKITDRKKAGKCSYCSREMIKCDVGTHILTNSHFSCFKKQCDRHVAYNNLGEHAKICDLPFSCPVCLTNFSELDLLTKHLTKHEPNILEIKTNVRNKLTVQGGITLLKEVTGDYYVVIFEGGKFCVQHLPEGIVRSYNVVFRNKDLYWEFEGQTTPVEKRPTLSARCFILPARTDPNFPVEVILHISHWA